MPPATFTDRNLFPLILWRIVNFSLEHGNTDASCYAYVHGGVLAGVRFGNYKAGLRLGQLGYDLVERRGLRRFKARTHIGFGVYNVFLDQTLANGPRIDPSGVRCRKYHRRCHLGVIFVAQLDREPSSRPAIRSPKCKPKPSEAWSSFGKSDSVS